MSGGFTIFQSAVSAIQVNSQAMSVTSNNIANLNTPGYSRQELIFATNRPQFIGGFEFGLGVQAAGTRRIIDSFAELRLIHSTTSFSQNNSRSQNLTQVEGAFNELNQAGLSRFITNFFSAYSEVASDPTSIPARHNLLGQAQVMVDRFHSLSQDLKDDRSLIDTQVTDAVNKINTLASEIATLNSNIQDAGDNAMTLRDQRTLKTRELADLIDVTPVETSDGVYQIYVASGLQLVNGLSYATVSTSINTSNDNHLNINYSIGGGAATNITSRISGGSLYGAITTRDTDIPLYQKRLRETAFEITNQVNQLHTTGYNLEGGTGLNFFDSLTDIAASTDLAVDLRNATGTHLGVKTGDTITIGGTLGTAFSTTYTVTSSSTLSDIASSLQTALRAASGASGTETATVTGAGTIQVTSGVNAITGLTLSISGNSTFNTAFTFTTPITAGGGTGASVALKVADPEAASFIALNSSVDDSPNNIAAAGSLADLPGGNSVAFAIANLQETNVAFSTGPSTIGDFYGQLMAKVGSDAQDARSKLEFTRDIYTQAQVQRENISGVSLDEEQANLIRYQAAFQASSRLISVANDLLEILANLGR